jgi:hypothetical protein
MKKVTSTLLMIGVLSLALAAVGCAQTDSDSMSGSNMDKSMESMSDDTMDKNMDKGMDDMSKDMDSMDAEKMDDPMEKNMGNDMK